MFVLISSVIWGLIFLKSIGVIALEVPQSVYFFHGEGSIKDRLTVSTRWPNFSSVTWKEVPFLDCWRHFHVQLFAERRDVVHPKTVEPEIKIKYVIRNNENLITALPYSTDQLGKMFSISTDRKLKRPKFHYHAVSVIWSVVHFTQISFEKSFFFFFLILEIFVAHTSWSTLLFSTLLLSPFSSQISWNIRIYFLVSLHEWPGRICMPSIFPMIDFAQLSSGNDFSTHCSFCCLKEPPLSVIFHLGP